MVVLVLSKTHTPVDAPGTGGQCLLLNLYRTFYPGGFEERRHGTYSKLSNRA